MRTFLFIAVLALAGCDKDDAYWQAQQRETEAKIAENEARDKAETRAQLDRWAIEENTQALQELSSKLR